MEQVQDQKYIIESLKTAFNGCNLPAIQSLSNILDFPPVFRAFAFDLLLTKNYPYHGFGFERGSTSVFQEKEDQFAEMVLYYVQNVLELSPYSGGILEFMNVSKYLDTFSHVNRQQSSFTVTLACRTIRDTLTPYGIDIFIDEDSY